MVTLTAGIVAACGSAPREDLVTQGRRVFVTAGCGACHTTAAAGTHGETGPDFDTSEPLDRAQIRDQLTQGVGGMPSFRGRLDARSQAAVTEFVYAVLHRPGRKAP